MGHKLVVITGAAGFIGSNLARACAAAGDRVVACDRLRQGGKWRNLRDIPLHDIVTPEALPAWLDDHRKHVARIFHMGAVSSTTETDIDRILRDNIRCSLDLWAWCAAHAVPFFYASSAATYGDGGDGFEDDVSSAALARLKPLNAYGWSKHMVDRRICADIADHRPAPPHWAGLKFFNVYGPGEDHKGDMRSLVTKIMPLIQAGEPVRLFRSHREDYSDGGQKRDFVYVDDVVAVLRWLSTASVSGLFNLGTGQARSWNDLAAAVFHAFGQTPRITYIDIPPDIRDQYQYFTQAQMTRLRTAGYTLSFTSLEDGVARYVRAMHP